MNYHISTCNWSVRLQLCLFAWNMHFMTVHSKMYSFRIWREEQKFCIQVNVPKLRRVEWPTWPNIIAEIKSLWFKLNFDMWNFISVFNSSISNNTLKIGHKKFSHRIQILKLYIFEWTVVFLVSYSNNQDSITSFWGRIPVQIISMFPTFFLANLLITWRVAFILSFHIQLLSLYHCLQYWIPCFKSTHLFTQPTTLRFFPCWAKLCVSVRFHLGSRPMVMGLIQKKHLVQSNCNR